jgi:hypothetical protein
MKQRPSKSNLLATKGIVRTKKEREHRTISEDKARHHDNHNPELPQQKHSSHKRTHTSRLVARSRVKNSPHAAMVIGVFVTMRPKATTPGNRCVLAIMELAAGGLLPVCKGTQDEGSEIMHASARLGARNQLPGSHGMSVKQNVHHRKHSSPPPVLHTQPQ